MSNFIEKWKKDKKFQTKIKLVGYLIFFVFALSYVSSISKSTISVSEEEEQTPGEKETQTQIKIPNKYEYTTEITINDKKYIYKGTKTEEEETINKEYEEKVEKYIFKNNKYYIEDNESYILIPKEKVYDEVNYNYINLESINAYLEKTNSTNSQKIVYIKDIILDNDTEDYFIIDVESNRIFIDYTPLAKLYNKEITNYTVKLEYEEIE